MGEKIMFLIFLSGQILFLLLYLRFCLLKL